MNSKVNRKILLFSGWAALVFAGCALLIGALELIALGVSSPVNFIKAGERWSASGEPYATIALYAEDDSALSKDQIERYAESMDSALLAASIDSSENGRAWTYAYSAETALSVTGPRSSARAAVTACGGDFFVFHPLNFLYGAPFLNDASIPNGVVLDENLAWKIFGALNVVGMEMSIGETTFTVTGVVAAERTSSAYSYTYGETPRMYMSYPAYDKINGEDADITVYEVTLPNPVKSFAMNIFETAVTVNEDTSRLAEVSARYGIVNRFENMKRLKYSWAEGERIFYPYWENEARMIDYTCAVIMIFEIIFLSVGVFALFLSFILFKVSGFSLLDAAKTGCRRIAALHAKRSGGKSRRKRRSIPDGGRPLKKTRVRRKKARINPNINRKSEAIDDENE